MAPQAEIFGLVHHAHAATAQKAQHPVVGHRLAEPWVVNHLGPSGVGHRREELGWEDRQLRRLQKVAQLPVEFGRDRTSCSSTASPAQA